MIVALNTLTPVQAFDYNLAIGRFASVGVLLAPNRRYCAFDPVFSSSPQEIEIHNEAATAHCTNRDGFDWAQRSTARANR